MSLRTVRNFHHALAFAFPIVIKLSEDQWYQMPLMLVTVVTLILFFPQIVRAAADAALVAASARKRVRQRVDDPDAA